MGGLVRLGWLETDNRAISVQLNLTGTATGTELGNKASILNFSFLGSLEVARIYLPRVGGSHSDYNVSLSSNWTELEMELSLPKENILNQN